MRGGLAFLLHVYKDLIISTIVDMKTTTPAHHLGL